jgi:hypothetical protein
MGGRAGGAMIVVVDSDTAIFDGKVDAGSLGYFSLF